MTGVSALTLARGRTLHLLNLIEGLRRCDPAPIELVIVDMNDRPLAAPIAPFPVRIVGLDGQALPLAAARNLAARFAVGRRLMFLDADCIPCASVIGAIDQALDEVDALVCPEARYLGPDDARGDWTESELETAGRRHPDRVFPTEGLRLEPNAGLFWSLAFGVRRETFDKLGGFDERFLGYGGEDTDLGFKARAAGVPLTLMGGPGVFHQHHPVSDPPVEHLDDIVRNARTFRDKWGRWPMEGWLKAFEDLGLISIGDGAISIRAQQATRLDPRRLQPSING